MSNHPNTQTEADVRWLAALFDAGRGGFTMRKQEQRGRKYEHPTIRLISTDQPIIDRAARVWGTTSRPVAQQLYRSPRTRWQSMVVGTNAVAWMHRIRPYLSGERAAELDRFLTSIGEAVPEVPAEVPAEAAA